MRKGDVLAQNNEINFSHTFGKRFSKKDICHNQSIMDYAVETTLLRGLFF